MNDINSHARCSEFTEPSTMEQKVVYQWKKDLQNTYDFVGTKRITSIETATFLEQPTVLVR
jgi:hypothetical protein